MNVRIRKLRPDAKMPTYGSSGAACFDLHAAHIPDRERLAMDEDGDPLLTQGASTFVGTGLAFEVPEGFAMLVYSRSGHGLKHGVRLANCVGVIDSDYRGEVGAVLHRDYGGGKHDLPIRPGDRIAQAMIVRAQRIQFEFADDLSATERGTGGFGSTGQ